MPLRGVERGLSAPVCALGPYDVKWGRPRFYKVSVESVSSRHLVIREFQRSHQGFPYA